MKLIPKQIMERARKAGLEKKLFLSSLAVILLLSAVIALLARWVVVSSLTTELKERGLGISYSIAEGSRGYILTENLPELTNLLFDARMGHRKPLVAYTFILDKENNMLSHSFTEPFPASLLTANLIKEDQSHAIALLRMKNESVYDIATPVIDGIYRVGTVHIGLKKEHIDQLVAKLRTTFLGFISAIAVLFFWISHVLSRQITRPMIQLAKVSDEISRGNLNIQPDIGPKVKCWEIKQCDKTECPAYGKVALPCWYVEDTLCGDAESDRLPEKLDICRACDVYQGCAGDEVVQLAHSFANMTVRLKYSEADLRNSEEKYRNLFDTGPNPIFVLLRKDNRILDANPMALETYGYFKEELIDMDFSMLGPFDFDEAMNDVNTGPQTDKCVVTEKVRHFKKGKKPIFVKVKACAATYKDMAVIILAATDITESIEKDAQLIHASKMTTLGELAAGVAHELNQPLNVIQMGSDYLRMKIEKDGLPTEEEIQLVTEQMASQVSRASDIINNLRDFGRKPDYEKHSLNINEPIHTVLQIFGKQPELQGITIEQHLDDRLPPILAHKNHLEQVFFNLILNARDAIIHTTPDSDSPRPKKITICTFQEEDSVAATVSDTGVGIPEDIQDRIFEPFFTTKEVGKGMGLGLSIIYRIVQDYNGKIDVSSQKGVETTFTLSFPMVGE